jgi:acetyl-CoA carboxylase carboxyl transferase subunit alpha
MQRTRAKLIELQALAGSRRPDLTVDIDRLQAIVTTHTERPRSAWERVSIARHPERPTSLDFIEYTCDRFMEFHGDRISMDDPAMIGGVGICEGIPITFLGHQKGRTLRSRIQGNVGMGEPSGYRKVLRLAQEAAVFGRPIVTFIDTPGVRANLRSEEQGIGEAIARNLLEFTKLKVPIIAIVIGEGGSGGALALSVADRIFMLENSIYYLISPEGLASILLKDPKRVSEAAEYLHLTAADLLEYGIIDGTIPEETRGAHEDFRVSAEAVRRRIIASIDELRRIPAAKLIKARRERITGFGRPDNRPQKRQSRFRRILNYRPSGMLPRSNHRLAK